jgi:arabinose-5-phosphate isomerase
MRADAALPTVQEAATVMDALRTMTRARAGACLILTGSNKLAGIFTHGDFARSFQKDPLLGDKPVAELMTRNPVTVRAEALAVEAIKSIGKNRIDDIIVINAEGTPVGLIDTQDLARLKLV